ncbi:glycosyltransferase [Flavobacterium sp. LB3P21]|uniref:glycosyltransferase n=1 Tax=Flavobacterium sp. LB3P21 TaxID=3401719 RepID=UPI003AACC866
MKTPLLSICLITYNHEKFIRQAIEGVLIQKVDFDWELIIADDCSTDRTKEIILEYKEKHPDFIKLILQEKNGGAAKNWMDLITTPKSKYIAYFEGDDYWSDPLKLQKQIDFLEQNEEYNIVWTKFNKINATGDLLESNMPQFEKKLEDVTIENFFENYRTWTLTCLFRTKIIKKYDLKSLKYSKDNSLYFLALKNSMGRVLDFNSACYRIHENGVWSSNSELEKSMSNFFNFDEIRKKIVNDKSIDIYLESNLIDIVNKIKVSKLVETKVYRKVFLSVMINLKWKWKLIFLKMYFIAISSNLFFIKTNNNK